MTFPARRLGAALATTLATAAVAAGALCVPAQAAAPAQSDLRPVISFYNASIEACKVLSADGRKVQLFAQLDNTRNRGANTRSGGLSISRNGDELGKYLRFPPTRAGARSKLKSITFSTGGAITVSAGIGVGQMGDGASFPFKRVRAC